MELRPFRSLPSLSRRSHLPSHCREDRLALVFFLFIVVLAGRVRLSLLLVSQLNPSHSFGLPPRFLPAMPVNPELFNTLTGVEVASQSFADAVVGPPVVGWTVELVLYGVVLSTTLAYVYSPLFAKESRYIRMLLAAVILLETVQSG